MEEEDQQKAAKVFEEHVNALDKLNPTLPKVRYIVKLLKEEFRKGFALMQNIDP